MSMDTDGYGGLAGFSGPALGDGSPVGVVRFQDLHRRHAPASAGLPEFGAVAETQAEQAPLGEPMEYAGFGFGEVPSYGAAPTSVTFKDGSFKYRVGTHDPFQVTILEAPAGNTKGDVSPSNTKAYEAIVQLAFDKFETEFRQAASEDAYRLMNEDIIARQSSSVAAPKTTPTTEREKAAQNDWTQSSAAQKGKDLVSGLLEGYKTVRGREADLAKQQASGDVTVPGESKALTYALWAGGALLGIGAIVLLVKAVSDDDDKKKGE